MAWRWNWAWAARCGPSATRSCAPWRAGNPSFRPDGCRTRPAKAAMPAWRGPPTPPPPTPTPTPPAPPVRGYGYHSIGARTGDGQLQGGRYLAAGSLEWQRPIVYRGALSDWESTLFIDAGAVADRWGR